MNNIKLSGDQKEWLSEQMDESATGKVIIPQRSYRIKKDSQCAINV